MNQPNILFIYSDQHRYDCLGINGHPLVQTPNMDRLAREGANFTHAFTPTPICVPARCSLLSGQWPSQNGVCRNFDGEGFSGLDAEKETCASLVRNAGYKTIHIGRWHVDPERTPHDYGFQDYTPDWRYAKWRKAQGLPNRVGPNKGFGQVDSGIAAKESSLAWAANQVISAIDKQLQADEDPFFLHWHMIEPHLPCRPCQEYLDLYKAEDIQPWPGFADTFAGKPWIQKQMRETWGVGDWTWEQWAPVVARYFAEITALDAQIGRVLDCLDERGIADNTLVMYSADHGDMCGDHGMMDKHNIMYDAVTRVPFMMRWPTVIPAGTTCDAFVSNAIDSAATFCSVAGVSLPESFSGHNLIPVTQGESNGRTDIYSTFSGNQFGGYSQRMVRDERWKYVWNATAEDELYDCSNDVGELINRAEDLDVEEELWRLRGRLAAWMEETGDPLYNGFTAKLFRKE